MRVDWAEPAAPAASGSELERVATRLLVAAAVELAALTVTGVLLLLFYRPSAGRAWGGRTHDRYPLSAVGLLRFAHRWQAHGLVVTLLAVAVVCVVRVMARSRRRASSLVLAGGALLVGLFASFTGFLLPWDQLALWAVKVGSNMMGYRPVISGGSNVQFVLIGGSQISVGTLRWWLLVHVVLAPAVLVALGAVLASHVGGHRSRRHTGLGS
ncbi:MAG: cytochrome b [Actinomycetota bacterium]|nr:cytochrome b [Actinomycetota bacterium]